MDRHQRAHQAFVRARADAEHKRLVAALVRELKFTGVVGVGHSMGGHAIALAAALAPEAFTRLSACTDSVIAAPVPTIEKLGGGSVRCMIAEVFLPRT